MNAIKALIIWIGTGFAEHFRKVTILAIFGALALVIEPFRLWLKQQAVCLLRGMCTLTGPRITALVLLMYTLAVAIVVVALRLWRSRASEAKLQQQLARIRTPFVPIVVEDHRYHLTWLMRRPPIEWCHFAGLYQVNAEYLAGIIDGPFHAEGCNGRLSEDWSRPQKGPFVDPTCANCGRSLWDPLKHDDEPKLIRQIDMRWQTLQELQRLNRSGNLLTATVVLGIPGYWRALDSGAPVR